MMHLTHSVRTVVNRLLHPRRLHSRFSGCTFASSLVVVLIAGLGPAAGAESEPLPSSVLILNQTRAGLPWFAAFSAAFESILNAGPVNRFSVYSENLDLNRFPGTQHQEVLRTYLQNKYRDTPIGVLVAQGSAALEFVMRSRAELWPAVPVIFGAVDEETAARLNLPSDVTGTIYRVPFDTMVAAAQALVPNLKQIALVGDASERQAFRRHYQQEIPAFAAQFEFIDLIGLPMTEIRKRVAVLPDDTAIIYTGLMDEGAGPHEGLAAFATVANRPIVIDAETSIGYGGTGGFVATPVPIGQAAARIALRILDGISESRLPAGSEVRFREFSLWEQYRWQMAAIFFALLL